MTSTKKSSKSKRTQIDLGRTANTRIVIDTTPEQITKQYAKDHYQKVPKLQRVRGGRYAEDNPPRGTSFEKKANFNVRIQDDPTIGLNHKYRHGYPHAVQITMDRRTYLQLQKFAHQEVRTPTGAVRQIINDAVKSVVIDPKLDVAKEEELLNAS